MATRQELRAARRRIDRRVRRAKRRLQACGVAGSPATYVRDRDVLITIEEAELFAALLERHGGAL